MPPSHFFFLKKKRSQKKKRKNQKNMMGWLNHPLWGGSATLFGLGWFGHTQAGRLWAAEPPRGPLGVVPPPQHIYIFLFLDFFFLKKVMGAFWE
jgi:hypothetical protein